MRARDETEDDEENEGDSVGIDCTAGEGKEKSGRKEEGESGEEKFLARGE